MKETSKKMAEELRGLAEMPDARIDTSDIAAMKDAEWAQASRGRFFRPPKKRVTLPLDADLLAWFREQGKGYQARINAALREFVEERRKG